MVDMTNMRKARAAFRRRCNGEPEIRAAGFRAWARASLAANGVVGKLAAIVR